MARRRAPSGKVTRGRGYFKLTGVTQLLQNLVAIPGKILVKALRPAIDKGSNTILRIARRLCPIMTDRPHLDTSGNPRQPLRRTLTKKRKTYLSNFAVVGIVGHRFPTPPHAHLVHDGTKNRITTIKNKKVLYDKYEGVFYGRKVHNKKMRKNPYLKVAFDSVKPRLEQIVRTEFLRNLNAITGGP